MDISVAYNDLLLYLEPQPLGSDGKLRMLNQGAIVTYKEFSLRLDGHCGIVEGEVNDQPNYVWVRWVGDTQQRKEYIPDLEVL